MRLWSLHPSHLDRAGLVAGWREALLAQAVLAERTNGYRNHPQLVRFRESPDAIRSIGAFLTGLHHEALERGYRFNASKILSPGLDLQPLPVTDGQMEFEWQHLGTKLAVRSPEFAERWSRGQATPHPLFVVRPGGIEPWERP